MVLRSIAIEFIDGHKLDYHQRQWGIDGRQLN